MKGRLLDTPASWFFSIPSLHRSDWTQTILFSFRRSDSWFAVLGTGLSLILIKGTLLKSSWQRFSRGILKTLIALLRYHWHAIICALTDNKLSIWSRQLGKFCYMYTLVKPSAQSGWWKYPLPPKASLCLSSVNPPSLTAPLKQLLICFLAPQISLHFLDFT